MLCCNCDALLSLKPFFHFDLIRVLYFKMHNTITIFFMSRGIERIYSEDLDVSQTIYWRLQVDFSKCDLTRGYAEDK